MSNRKYVKEKLRLEHSQLQERKKQEERKAALWGIPIIGVGCMLLMWQTNIFHETFVPVRAPLLILLVFSFSSMPFLKNLFVKRLMATNTFHILFYCTFTSGCLFSTAFMATNYYFANREKISETANIVGTGYSHPYKKKCNVPYIEIEHKNISKKFEFTCGTPVNNYKYIDITYKTGLWGYDVIVDKRLHN